VRGERPMFAVRWFMMRVRPFLRQLHLWHNYS
jgi:hypothetical protein